jgi:hypothetical protein
MKEDVKREFSPLPSRKAVWLASSPCPRALLLRGVLGLPLWIAAQFSGDASPVADPDLIVSWSGSA